MEPNELKLEVLRLAAREDVAHGDADKALEIAAKFWAFVGGVTDPGSATAGRQGS